MHAYTQPHPDSSSCAPSPIHSATGRPQQAAACLLHRPAARYQSSTIGTGTSARAPSLAVGSGAIIGSGEDSSVAMTLPLPLPLPLLARPRTLPAGAGRRNRACSLKPALPVSGRVPVPASNPWQSVAISGNQWQSVAIKWQPVGISGNQVATSGNQWESVGINGVVAYPAPCASASWSLAKADRTGRCQQSPGRRSRACPRRRHRWRHHSRRRQRLRCGCRRC